MKQKSDPVTRLLKAMGEEARSSRPAKGKESGKRRFRNQRQSKAAERAWE